MRSNVPGLLVLASCVCAATSAASDATPPTPEPATAGGSGGQRAPAARATAGEDPPRLGVQIDERAAFLDSNNGLPVAYVIPGSTAAAIGVLIGDRITAINGSAVTTSTDLQTTLSACHLGDPIRLEVLRREHRTILSGTMQRGTIITCAYPVDLRANNHVTGKREASLADIVQTLDNIQTQLPRTVAEFKVRVVTDRTAKDHVDLVRDRDDAAAGSEATTGAGKDAGADRTPSSGDTTQPAPR